MITDRLLEHTTLKLRVVLLAAVIILVALAVGGVFLVHNARDAISSEVRSSIVLAQTLLAAAVNAGAPRTEIDLPRIEAALDAMRHVRVAVVSGYPAAGALVADEIIDPAVPRWLTRLLTPSALAAEQVVMPLGIAGQAAVIAGDPTDELREIWRDVKTMTGFVLGGAGLLLWLIHVTMRVGLQPLARLLVAFDSLKQGRFSSRVDERAVPELREIHHEFNHVAGVLERMVEDNRRLTGALMTVQEEERKTLAHDLHDEMAPLLFSVRVAANAARADATAEPIRERIDEIDRGVVHLQTQVRRMLTRLRPHALETLGFENAVNELVDSWRQRVPGIDWQLQLDALPTALTEALSTDVYLITQEGLTNIARHAEAGSARVEVTVTPGGKRLRLVIEDDGRGIDPAAPRGYGLLGMHERVRRRGGTIELQTGTDGTRIVIDIPIDSLLDTRV